MLADTEQLQSLEEELSPSLQAPCQTVPKATQRCLPITVGSIVLTSITFFCWGYVLLHGVKWAPQLMHHVGFVDLSAPVGTPQWFAHEAVITGVPEKLNGMFPLNVIVYIRAQVIEGVESSINTVAVAEFSRTLVHNLSEHVACINGPNVSSCESGNNATLHALTRLGRAESFYVTPNANAALFVMHLKAFDPTAYYKSEKLCEEWTGANGQLRNYSCIAVGEWTLGRLMEQSTISRLEGADFVGVPLALVALLRAIGLQALLVLITLPVGILCSFDLMLQLTLKFPGGFKAPNFALSLVMSISLAMSLDYALFMGNSYKIAYQRIGNSRKAIMSAFTSSGRTILISGFILAFSNLGGLLVSDITLRSLLISVAVGSLITTGVNLTLLPSLLFVFGPCLRAVDTRYLQAWRRRCCICQGPGSAGGVATAVLGEDSRGHSKASVAHIGADGRDVREMRLFEGFEIEDHISQADAQSNHVSSVFWDNLARVIQFCPRVMAASVILVGMPVCLQARRLHYTISMTDLVPASSQVMRDIFTIGQDFPLAIFDTKHFLVQPRRDASVYENILPASECLDDDAYIRDHAARRGYGNEITCSMAVHIIGCNYTLAEFTDVRGSNRSMQLQNFCPHSCPKACTAASTLSRPFLLFTANVSQVLEEISHRFSRARNLEWYSRSDFVESVSSLDGQAVTFDAIRRYLGSEVKESGMHNNTAAEAGKDFAARYVERFHGLSNFDRSRLLLHCMFSFNPFSETANDWVNEVYKALEDNVETVTEHGPMSLNRPTGDYEVLFGDILNEGSAAVDSLFSVTNAIRLLMLTIIAVVLTSTLAFRSVLIGPRLLLTVLYSISFTLGALVILWMDLGGSSGIFWLVFFVGIPVALGLTLDYDIFLLSRCYERRLEGMSTEKAIASALRETGPVITTAGSILVFAFASLLFTGIPCLQQLGAILVICSLIDTFVVRTLLVPSIMLLLVDYTWWPGRVPVVTNHD